MIPIPTPSPSEIWHYWDVLKEKFDVAKLEEIAEKMSMSRSRKELYEFVKEIYPDIEMPSLNGNIYPIALFRAPIHQRDNPESILASSDWDSHEIVNHDLAEIGKEFRKIREKSGSQLWNGETFRMLKLETKNELKIHCGLGRYFTALDTCDSLEWELLIAFSEKYFRIQENTKFAKELKLRGLINQHSVIDPSERSAAIGISTMILFRHKNGFKTIVWERSNAVGPHHDLVHVIPSFMFGPEHQEYDNEFSIKHNVYREYLEEVFDFKEVNKAGRIMAWDHFYSNPDLKYLISLEKSNKAKIYLTGVAINLLNLRPEICTLLLIDADEWYENHKGGNSDLGISKLQANYEFKDKEDLKAQGKKAKIFYDIDSNFSLPDIDEFSPSKMVPPGAAALILGLETAKDILSVS